MNKNNLDESVKIKAYSKNDHYVNYMEMESNPASLFELTKFGKTYAYIDAPIISRGTSQDGMGAIFQS